MAVYLNVLHDFNARSPDELSLKKGTQIELVERDDEYGDGWYSGKDLVTGHIGLFPQVYTVLSTSGPVSHSEPASQVAVPTINTITTPPATPGIFGHGQNDRLTTSAPLADTPQETGTAVDASQEPILDISSLSSAPASAISTPFTTTDTSNGIHTLEDHATTLPVSASETVREEESMHTNDTSAAQQGSQAENPKVQMMRSPVVQDTLSDIEEAISEITTPRTSGATHSRKNSALQPPPTQLPRDESYGSHNNNNDDDSASDYSRNALGNESQISLDTSGGYAQNGNNNNYPVHHHMDDNISDSSSEASMSEDGQYSLDEVKSWTPAQVSAYLQEQHIPVPICEKFEDQEISGSILLQLEMAHLKELDINSFGKRFQVWKEIERLMETVGMSRSDATTSPNGGTPERTGSSLGMAGGAQDRGRRQRSNAAVPGTVLPRLPSLHNRPPSKKNALSVPRTHREGSQSYDSPDAALQGSRKTSRRRSSREYATDNSSGVAGLESPQFSAPEARPHDRQPSFDRNWTSGSGQAHKVTDSTATGGSRFTGDSGFAGSQPATPNVLPGSNISSDEGKARERKVLHKKSASKDHSRKSSHTEEARVRTGTANTVRHSRLSSVENKSGASSPSTPMSPASMAYHMPKSKKKLSGPPQDAHLYEQPRTPGSRAQSVATKDSLDPISSTSSETLLTKPYAPPPPIQTQSGTTRAVSDGAAKALALSSKSIESGSATPNGGGSASSMTLTFEPSVRRSHESKDRNVSTPVNKKLRSVASASGIRQKSKKHETSAWREGLKEITPAQAAAEGDFSGWMKKRGSGGVVSSWKTRFFVLKGRRLSYFISETDTKERGLIDMTSHRVLNAADDRLVSLQASVAARTSKTTPGQESSGSTGPGATPIPSPTTPHHKSGWFTFKLVPPAPGAAKGVMFTPPKVHYFATDTKGVGRQWMAAMMKATIDRDETQPVVSSFTAETISLAKAQELKARPPGFGDDALETDNGAAGGLDFDLGSPGTPETPGSSMGNRGSTDLKPAGE